MRTFRLFMPEQAVGLSLVYFDLFNATGSASRIQLLSVQPVISGDVAVVGTLGVDLYLTRTTAIGTTGTAATNNGTSLTAATFTGLNHTQSNINPSITARLSPGGGATAGAVISQRSVFTEETAVAAYATALDMVQTLWDANGMPVEYVIDEGTGIRVVQGGVASVGNIGFNVTFNVIPNA